MYELSFISLLALCMVSFIGVPHGSFDGAVAALLGYKTRKDFFIFVLFIHLNTLNQYLKIHQNTYPIISL